MSAALLPGMPGGPPLPPPPEKPPPPGIPTPPPKPPPPKPRPPGRGRELTIAGLRHPAKRLAEFGRLPLNGGHFLLQVSGVPFQLLARSVQVGLRALDVPHRSRQRLLLGCNRVA